MKKFYFVIDVGNTNIKLALFNFDKTIYKKFIVNNNNRAEGLVESFKQIIKEKDYIQSCFLGSVNNEIKNDVKPFVIDVLGKNPYEISNLTEFGFKFNKKNVNEVGNDILGLCQFASKFNNDSAIFSFGTANLALLLKDKTLQGAVISGGLENSYNSLIKSASLINELNIDKESTKTIGNDTKSALEAGYFHQRNGFILSVLQHFGKLITIKESNIFITGGSSLIEYDNKNYLYVENAVLLGYLDILLQNKKVV